MSDTVIKVENLSKSYTLRHQTGERYTALRDVLANGAKTLGSRLMQAATSHQPPATSEEFWALDDVSFEVKQGERVGREPIGRGRNGAGKSTLTSGRLNTRLKILSRIPSPTKGWVHIKGRAFGEPGAPGARAVASLLEVARPRGTRRCGRGFHPELTVHENIYLNGAILGMSRSAIRRKFDEMVMNTGV
ncbi:MAG: ATP-binding cassette domain-containing protein [Caldilineaceae bacterium]